MRPTAVRREAGTSAPANSPYSHISRLMPTSRARTIRAARAESRSLTLVAPSLETFDALLELGDDVAHGGQIGGAQVIF